MYLPTDDRLPEERWHLGGIAEGGFDAARAALETVYGALHVPLEARRAAFDHLHPGKSAATDAGWFGELHPTLLEGRWGAFALDVEKLMEPLPERVLYDDVITFPANRQDIAVSVPEDVEVGAMVTAAHEAAGAELREVKPFDVYRGAQVGAGHKSVALHLVFQSPERTLTDDDAARLRDRIVATLAERFDAELRA